MHTCIQFTFTYKIEAMYEKSHINLKFEPRLTSHLSLTIYILPLFLWVKFMCVYTYAKITRRWTSTLKVHRKSIVYIFKAPISNTFCTCYEFWIWGIQVWGLANTLKTSIIYIKELIFQSTFMVWILCWHTFSPIHWRSDFAKGGKYCSQWSASANLKSIQ